MPAYHSSDRTLSVFGRPVSVHHTPTNPFNSNISTRDTVEILAKLARQYARCAEVQIACTHAFARLPTRASQRAKATAIFQWVRGNVAFVEDEWLMYEALGVQPQELDKELLLIPPVLFAMPVPMGDCDDFSLLVACMCLACGLRPYFVTVAADATDPQKFSHIYVCVRLEDEGTYLSLDAGNRFAHIPAGWESGGINRKAAWAI